MRKWLLGILALILVAAIAFFTSEEASFVSGQVLYVAGGPKA